MAKSSIWMRSWRGWNWVDGIFGGLGLPPQTQDLWRLSTDESALLPGMTDKGRLGFAIQLKFMQLHGRFPERH